MGKVFSHPARQEQFERSTKVLRKMFPNAKESFIRKQAQSAARNVPVEKMTRKPRLRPNVAAVRPSLTPPQAMRADSARRLCKRLPSTSPKAERTEAHRDKMLWKSGHRGGGRKLLYPRANLSRNHPDYGCTPSEHARRKAGRNG